MSVEVILLGSAQDAGVPQSGCNCENCKHIKEFAACLGIIDHSTRSTWMIDATPNFPEQLRLLQQHATGYTFNGILLTHAHIGHYLGLAYLGREAMNTRELPIYGTASVCKFLKENGPWSLLVSERNIVLNEIEPDREVRLSDSITVTPTLVPHRAEFSDTVAYSIRGETASVFYCPDIDRWEQWSNDLSPFLNGINFAFLDGTFFSDGELPNRDMSQIPHPLATDTVARVEGSTCQIYFIHLNHTNPLLHEGEEREWLKGKGMSVGAMGTRVML